MRHGMRGRKFNRPSAQRKALLIGLAKSLIDHEQITTTVAKAKDLRPYVEKLVTLGRRGGLHAFRQAMSVLGDVSLTQKLTGTLATRYKERPGGYIRIVKAGYRHGDNAPMAIIEFVDRDVAAKGASTPRVAKADAEDATSAVA